MRRPDLSANDVVQADAFDGHLIGAVALTFRQARRARLLCAVAAMLVSLGLQLALTQDFTLRYFELAELYHTPGLVQLSPEYQTVIEFDGLTVERVSSGRVDEIVAEVVDNTIRLRANGYVVNTDLTVTAGGRTALFKLTSSARADAPRVYLVRNNPHNSTPQGRPGRPTDEPEVQSNTPVVSPLPHRDPDGVDFRASAFHTGGQLILQYVLGNSGGDVLTVEPARLSVRYGDIALDYTLERVSVSSNPDTLSPGEADYGTLLVDNPPRDTGKLELRWTLLRGKSANHSTLVRSLEAIPVGIENSTPFHIKSD